MTIVICEVWNKSARSRGYLVEGGILMKDTISILWNVDTYFVAPFDGKSSVDLFFCKFSVISKPKHPVETSNKVRIRKCLRLLTFWVDHVMAGPLVTFSLNSIN